MRLLALLAVPFFATACDASPSVDELRLNTVCGPPAPSMICEVGPRLRVLRGSQTQLTIEYVTAGKVAVLDHDATLTRGPGKIEHIDGLDVLVLPGADAPYTTTIASGGTTLTVEVEPVAPADVTLSLEEKVGTDNMRFRATLRDRDGTPVLAHPFAWFLDGALIEDKYQTAAMILPVDPAAPAVELRVRVGDFTAAAAFHAAPI